MYERNRQERKEKGVRVKESTEHPAAVVRKDQLSNNGTILQCVP